MKKILAGIYMAAVLSGCAAQPMYETIGDVWEQTQPALSPGHLQLHLPEGTRMEVMDSEADGYYTIGTWEIWTKVLPGGDLNRTLETISPVDPENLTVIQRQVNGYDCAETLWTTTSEAGSQVVRTGIITDGAYHYCICISVPQEEAEAGEDVFRQMFSTASVTNTAP